MRIVGTMTTIPSRIAYLRPVIESVLAQTVVVSHLEINIPLRCVRTQEDYVIPDWMVSLDRVKVHRTEDYGAITKVAPTLLRYVSDTSTYLWCVDDDFCYPSNQLALLLTPFDPARREILCRYGGHLSDKGKMESLSGTGYVDYFEGFGSILYPPGCIAPGFASYVALTAENANCRRADDIVLSMYFKHIGVRMKMHNVPTDEVPWMLEGAAPQGNIQALSVHGHGENYKIVYAWVRSLLDTGIINGRKSLKILNLILYSPDPCYDMMADALEKYLTAKGIEHYFYSFREDLDADHLIEGSHLYIRGTETFLPGILSKTLKALEVIADREYDYVVRSNVSTIIDFDEMHQYLVSDYSGLGNWPRLHIDLKAGITSEKLAKYSAASFISGICVILSRRAVKMLVAGADRVLSYGIIDDVSIGIYFHEQQSAVHCSPPKDWSAVVFNAKHRQQGIVAYRNNSDSRTVDVCRMRVIIAELLA